MIKDDNGPMEIININNSNNFNKNDIKFDFFKFNGDTSDVFIFKPNLCFHRAGVPKDNLKRKQVMIQLNPSKEWRYNESIQKRQKKREPKFPLITYLLDKKIKLYE